MVTRKNKMSPLTEGKPTATLSGLACRILTRVGNNLCCSGPIQLSFNASSLKISCTILVTTGSESREVCYIFITYTVKPVNKGHPREKQNMVFIDKWSLFGGYFVLFYQGSVIEVWPLFTGWSLFRGSP